ncbi:hypothetical protein TeGR_g8838, partial [Tetraparma gracilis]
VNWFIGLASNRHLARVDPSFISDSFNLYGLRAQVPSFTAALAVILDQGFESDSSTSEQDVNAAAGSLYGFIHGRWILTAQGLEAVHHKFKAADYGLCPCCRFNLLPTGLSDVPNSSRSVLYCASCARTFQPPPDQQHDSAFFGTSMPSMFFMAYPSHVPHKPSAPPPADPPALEALAFLQAHDPYPYTPTVFGFKVHQTSPSLPSHVRDYRGFLRRAAKGNGGGGAGVVSENGEGGGAGKAPGGAPPQAEEGGRGPGKAKREEEGGGGRGAKAPRK